MANPEAVMRAAQAGPKPMMGGGMPPGGAPDMLPAGGPPKAPDADGGVDQMVEALQGVGTFLQSQGPAGQEAMEHFQALVQAMAKMGGAEAPQAPQGEPQEPGRIHESQVPGVRVL